MARKIDLTQSPESHCPRFDICSINKCPLHKDYEKLLNHSSDPSKIYKEKCTDKKIRKEIGKAFGLKYGGMTTREFHSSKRWVENSTLTNSPENVFSLQTKEQSSKNASVIGFKNESEATNE